MDLLKAGQLALRKDGHCHRLFHLVKSASTLTLVLILASGHKTDHQHGMRGARKDGSVLLETVLYYETGYCGG
jgi:hypothetical protein